MESLISQIDLKCCILELCRNDVWSMSLGRRSKEEEEEEEEEDEGEEEEEEKKKK